MNKTALHKILAIILICAVCLSCGVYAFASESEKAPNNNVVNLACKTVVDYEEANGYYDVTQVSGEITNIEQVSGGVNAYVIWRIMGLSLTLVMSGTAHLQEASCIMALL